MTVVSSPVSFIRPERSSHWYREDGTPCHEVPRADGKGMRPTNLGDAKELGLYPSSTNILGATLNKPALNAWIAGRYREAAWLTDKMPGEDRESYLKRIDEYADAPGDKATDFGTRLHASIEHWLESRGEYWTEDEEVQPFLEGFAEWFKLQGLQVIHVEMPFCNVAEGFGGTTDCITQGDDLILVDWTTRKGGEVKHYPEKELQVASYVYGLGLDARAAIVTFSSELPGKLAMWQCDRETLADRWALFQDARNLFYGVTGKGYGLPWKKK